MDDKRRVVVTGMGVLAPNGHGLPEFEKSLREGRSAITHVPYMKELALNCQVGGMIEGLDALTEKYFTPEVRMSMKAVLIPTGSIAALDAWTDAGFEIPDPADDRVRWDTGAYLGTGTGGSELASKARPDILAGRSRRLGGTHVEQTMVSGLSARVAGLLALGNHVSSNSSACTTGTEAIAMAFHAIRDGRADRMLAGGAEASDPEGWAAFDAMRVLVRDRNHEPAKASRPLSATASGFVASGGAGVLVLEELEVAMARGARIYAEIVGGALNCGGHRMGGSMTAPNSTSVQRCIRDALVSGKVRPEEVDLISGHLTGTMADPLEVANWKEALGVPLEKFPWINAPKSILGHALGAAGGIESVAAVLQLAGGFIHPSLNCEDIHPRIEPFAARIPQRMVQADLRVLAKASFGFGDVNGCVIYRKWEN